jgi:hypothetical protein
VNNEGMQCSAGTCWQWAVLCLSPASGRHSPLCWVVLRCGTSGQRCAVQGCRQCRAVMGSAVLCGDVLCCMAHPRATPRFPLPSRGPGEKIRRSVVGRRRSPLERVLSNAAWRCSSVGEMPHHESHCPHLMVHGATAGSMRAVRCDWHRMQRLPFACHHMFTSRRDCSSLHS